MPSVKDLAECTQKCSEDQSKCLASNAAIQGAPAICSGQEAICLGSCSKENKSGLGAGTIAWIVVLAVIGAAILLYVGIRMQRAGYVDKIKRRVKTIRARRSRR